MPIKLFVNIKPCGAEKDAYNVSYDDTEKNLSFETDNGRTKVDVECDGFSGEEQSNEELFDHTFKEVLENCVRTSSHSSILLVGNDETLKGSGDLFQLSMRHLFQLFSNDTEGKFHLTVSFLEFKDDKVYNLLVAEPKKESKTKGNTPVKRPTLKIRLEKLFGSVALGRNEEPLKIISKFADLMDFYSLGKKNQTPNSHSVFTIFLTRVDGKKEKTYSKLIFGELHTDERKLPMVFNCIRYIKRGKAHIPYRDSSLSFYLNDSLLSNSTVFNMKIDEQEKGEYLKIFKIIRSLKKLKLKVETTTAVEKDGEKKKKKKKKLAPYFISPKSPTKTKKKETFMDKKTSPAKTTKKKKKKSTSQEPQRVRSPPKVKSSSNIGSMLNSDEDGGISSSPVDENEKEEETTEEEQIKEKEELERRKTIILRLLERVGESKWNEEEKKWYSEFSS